MLVGLATAARAGTGRVAVVLGEPGVGKSRLLEELRARMRDETDVVWVLGRCAPFDEDLPYHLLTSLVRSMAGVASTALPEVVAKSVSDLAERCGAGEQTETLKRLVGVPGEYPEVVPEALVASYGTALLDVLRGLASRGTRVVLVCEDVHWADPSSVEVASRLVAAVPSLPVLLLMAMRPDRDATGWGLLESARRELGESLTEIQLSALGDAQSRELLAHLLEIESLPPSLRTVVTTRAEGNPFFLEEVVRTLIERGLVDHVDGRWVARAEVAELDVPYTIQGLLAARIDRLDPAVRRAGRVASVIGRQFSVPLFARVYDAEEQAGLHPHLAVLESHGLLRLEATTPELRFGFRHALIHDVMYQGLLRRERRALHHKVAAALEAEHPDRRDELAGILARHYERSGDVALALQHLFVAADRALRQGARVEAARFYGQARSLLRNQTDADPAARIDAAIGLVSAGLNFTPLPESRRTIDEVIPLAERLDDPDRLAALYAWDTLVRGLAQSDGGSDPSYGERLEHAYALLPRLTSTSTAALLRAARGSALRSADRYAEALEPLSLAVDGLETVGDLAAASFNASMLADTYAQLGRFAEAEAAVERAAELAARSGDPNSILDADIIRGFIAANRGDLSSAMEYTQRGVAAAESVGNTFCTLAGSFIMGEVQLRRGEVDAAITNLQKSTGLAQYCNAVGYEVLGQAWLAAARAHQGPMHREDFEEPLRRAVAMGTPRGEGLVLLQRATAASRHGQYEAAVPDFERALTCFAEYGGKPLIARTELAFGTMLEAAGRRSEAEPHLAAARRLLAELGIHHEPPAAEPAASD